MEPRIVLLEAAFAVGLSASLALYVALQRPRTSLHGPVATLLLAFVAWTTGLVLLHVAPEGSARERAGLLALFGAIMLAAPLWLFICARLTATRPVADQPVAALAALLTPGLLHFAALATDAHHGWFAHRLPPSRILEPAASWAGPLFWTHTAWSYACIAASIALCLRAARRSASPLERRRLCLVAFAALVPVVTTALAVTGLTPSSVPLTPADLGVTAALLVTAIVRYRFLDACALPASEVIQHLSDALLLADTRGEVIDANPAAESLLRLPLPHLRGQLLSDIVRSLDPGGAERLEQSPSGALTFSVTSRDDRVVDVSLGHVDSGRRRLGSFLVLRDRTEERRRERWQYRAQRLESLGVLAAGIAHEINNPLAYVRTNLGHLVEVSGGLGKRLAGAGAPAPEVAELEEVLLETQAGVDRISRIVDGTRRLSREAGAERERLDLNAVVREALHVAELHAHRRVRVETRLADPLPAVWGSAEQVGQVALNLLINAKQAAGPGPRGRIRVTTRSDGAVVELDVEDDGPGIDPADRERIFDPFYTTKGPDEGTGLGLAIAFEIAGEHDGTLEVGASDLGGARFSLRLPMAA